MGGIDEKPRPPIKNQLEKIKILDNRAGLGQSLALLEWSGIHSVH
jgi:hypothetical protein